jgi:RAT1-interacting protein
VILTFVQEIAYFSFDDKHQFHLDDSSLRYYYPPNLPADLNDGFDQFQQLDDTNDGHLDALLDTIVSHEQIKGSKIDTDIITWRGMITKVRALALDRFGAYAKNRSCVHLSRNWTAGK